MTGTCAAEEVAKFKELLSTQSSDIFTCWCEQVKGGTKSQKRAIAVEASHFSTFKKKLTGIALSKRMDLVDLREISMPSKSSVLVAFSSITFELKLPTEQIDEFLRKICAGATEAQVHNSVLKCPAKYGKSFCVIFASFFLTTGGFICRAKSGGSTA